MRGVKNIVPTSHEKIVVLRGENCDRALLNGKIDELGRIAREQDGEKIKAKLQEIVSDNVPAENHRSCDKKRREG